MRMGFIWLRGWLKNLSLKKVLYAPRAFSPKEKFIILGLAAVVLLSGGILFSRLYLRFTEPRPSAGGKYSEALLKEPRNINPLLAVQDADRDISRLVFSSLFTYDGVGTLVPDLAENLEISPDGKTYTVVLKKNIKWHDGAKLNSDDIIFTVRMAQNPQYKSILRPNWQGVEAEALDSYTVRFSLKTAYSPFIENLALGIIPKHLWENVNPEQAPLHEFNLKPIGSGPYKFNKLKQDRDGSLIWYRLERNRDYYHSGPYISEITFFFFKSEEDIMRGLNKKTVQGFGPVSLAYTKDLEILKGNLYQVSMPRVFGIFFNDKQNELLSDKKVREAVARALDREKIIEGIVAGGAINTETPFPFLKGDQQDKTPYIYDPDASRKLLESGGWKVNPALDHGAFKGGVKEGGGIRYKVIREKGKESTRELKFTLITADLPDLTGAANRIKELLKEAGIDITVKVMPFAELEASVIRPRNFEILLFGQIYGYEPDPFAFWHSSQIKDPGLNVARFVNKKVDEMLEESRRTFDRQIRDQKYREAARIIMQEVPAVFLYSQLYFYFLPADIKGVDLPTITLPADRFNEINKWYLDTKRVFK